MQNNENNNNSNKPKIIKPNNNNNNISNNVDKMTQDEIDNQIRLSWVRGSRVEVFSRGGKKWLRGMVTRVFTDDEGILIFNICACVCVYGSEYE